MAPKDLDCAATASSIEFDYLTPDDYAVLEANPQSTVIAAVADGRTLLSQHPWPQVHGGLPSLMTTSFIEVIRTAGPVEYGRDDGFALASTPDYLFASCIAEAPGHAHLGGLAEDLYGRLIDLVQRRGYPHLLRIWNILPKINDDQDGMERYKLFCIGRSKSFQAKLPNLTESYPAACGVGCDSDDLCFYVLAARSPGLAIENPKQVSAYAYPPRYGPKSPSFSRALVKTWAGGAGLFLSGTASIVGHESRHREDLRGQVAEMLDNLETLTRAGSEASGVTFALAAPSSRLKVYIRRPEHYLETRRLLEDHFDTAPQVIYVQADLCRSELLVELDGIAYATID